MAPLPNRLVYLHGLLTVSAGEWAKFTERSVFEDLYFDWQVKDESRSTGRNRWPHPFGPKVRVSMALTVRGAIGERRPAGAAQ